MAAPLLLAGQLEDMQRRAADVQSRDRVHDAESAHRAGSWTRKRGHRDDAERVSQNNEAAASPQPGRARQRAGHAGHQPGADEP